MVAVVPFNVYVTVCIKNLSYIILAYKGRLRSREAKKGLHYFLMFPLNVICPFLLQDDYKTYAM